MYQQSIIHLIIAYDNAVHRQKLMAEVSQAKREANHYLLSVDRQKMRKAITERKRKAGTYKEEVFI